MHVVHEHHDRLAGDETGEERQPVLDVDHQVDAPVAAHQDAQCGDGVDLVRSFSVEPTTGVILVGSEQQDSYLAVDGERRLTTTKVTLGYTDETAQTLVDEYESKAFLLGLVKSTIPLVGLVLGVLLIGLGLLSRRGRRPRISEGHRQQTPVGAGAA